MDELGIDVLLTGAQKALALPPGFALFQRFRKSICTRRKTKRSRLLFRFPRVQKTAKRMHDPEHAEHRPHFRAAIKARRYFRRRLCRRVLRVTLAPMRWSTTGCAGEVSTFSPKKIFAPSLSPASKISAASTLPKLVRDLREKHHLVIDGGYGKIKGQTFRLSNMGDETEETVAHLLACLDDCLG